jgi:hypothetical protein
MSNNLQIEVVWFGSVELVIISSVLKTGPNRPVGPVRPRTGGVTGLVRMLDRPCSYTGGNRSKPEKPVNRCFFQTAGLIARAFFFFFFSQKSQKTSFCIFF